MLRFFWPIMTRLYLAGICRQRFFAAEELEESAKLAVILRNERVRYLTHTEVEDQKTTLPIG